jgi:polyferredoxin
MVGRPAGVEGWLPIQGLMQFRYVLATGQLPRVHPAGFFLFLSFAVISLLFRKSFCGWLCPVGTVSEYLWKLGQYTFGRNFQLPRAVHRHISKRTPKGACAQALVTAAHAARLLHKRLG